ncbi:MAG: TniQ family protein [Oceanospirillaceae bacterium]|nr:TniQ family protein [Oceanospirillaceae bacterium]
MKGYLGSGVNSVGLPYVFLPRPHESMRGYVWKLAIENGYPDPSTMISVMDLPSANWTAASTLKRCLEQTQIKSSIIDGWLYSSHGGGECLELNAAYPIRDWSLRQPTFCLKCLVEGLPILEEWCLPHIEVCREHNAKLLHLCPQCGATLEWNHHLEKGCSICELRWQEYLSPAVGIPDYQNAWYQADDLVAFRVKFSAAILQAARPRLIDPDKCSRFDLSLEDRSSLMEVAYFFYKHPSLSLAYFARRHPSLCYENQSTNHDSVIEEELNSLMRMLADRNYSVEDVFIPPAFSPLLASRYEDSVNAMTAAKLLGLSDYFELLEFERGSERYGSRLRKFVSVLEKLGLEQIEMARRADRKRYLVEDLERLIDITLPVSAVDAEDNLVWIEPNSSILTCFELDYISFLDVALFGQQSHSVLRQKARGLGCVGFKLDSARQIFRDRLMRMEQVGMSFTLAGRLLGMNYDQLKSKQERGVLKQFEAIPAPQKARKRRTKEFSKLDVVSVLSYCGEEKLDALIADWLQGTDNGVQGLMSD